MPGDHDYKKKKKELKEKLAKIGADNKRGDVDVDKNEQYKSVATNEYYNKHDADMGGYNKDILDKVQLKNQKKGKKVPQNKIRETPTKENNYQTHMDSKGAFEQRALKEKVKKADLSGIVKEQKKKKGKERLVHKASKGVDTYSSQDPKNSKVKKKHVKGKISKQLIALRKKVNKIKNNPPQGPSGGTADTPESIIKDAEAVAKTPSYIAKDHDHTITFKGYKGAQYKRASLISNTGKYAKYWLLNAKQTNGNGWGVSQQSIAKNIHKFVGKPLVVTAKSWIPDSEYGDAYEHPYLPTNDINKVFDHQEKFRVGSIVDIIEKDGDYFANIELNQKFAHMVMPPFCSPAIFQNNPSEPEGQISDWEALHLAALHEDPAYGSRIALLRGTCVGTKDQCTVQFKAAKQQAKMVCTKGIKERLAGLFPKEKTSDQAIDDVIKDIKDPDLREDAETRHHHTRPKRLYNHNRKAKLKQRLGGLTERDVEISHEGPVTRRKADKPVKKFYEEKHKTYGEDRIKKIREEAKLEGMFETGDKRIPLQKVDKPFHSKKPFLSSFTPDKAKKYAKLKQRLALEGGRHGNRKYWLYKDGTISKESGWHNQIHPNDIGEMESGSVKITHENDIINDKYFHVDLRTNLTKEQKNHLTQQIKENNYDKLNRYGDTNINFNHGHNKKNTLSSTNKYLDSEFPQIRGLYRSSYIPENRTHTQNLAGKLRQRIAGIQRTAKPIIQETGEGITFRKVNPRPGILGKSTYGYHKVPMHPSNSILIRPRDPKNYMDLVNHFRKIHETPDFAKFTHGSVQQTIPINSLRNNIKHMTGEPLKRHADISTAANKAFKKGDILMRRVGGRPQKGKYGTVGETFYIEEDSPTGETFNAPSKYNRP